MSNDLLVRMNLIIIRMRMKFGVFDIKSVYLMYDQQKHKEHPNNYKEQILGSKPMLASPDYSSSKSSLKSHSIYILENDLIVKSKTIILAIFHIKWTYHHRIGFPTFIFEQRIDLGKYPVGYFS